jgi:hypothetical protein
MILRHALLPLVLLFLSAASLAAEIGVATLADAGARVLRGATWYKLVPGLAVEYGDIVAAGAKSQVQLEFANGTIVSFFGDGSLYISASSSAPPLITMTSGFLKASVKAPGMRVDTLAMDMTIAEGIVVLRADAKASELFVESGAAVLADAGGTTREARRGEYWSKIAAGAMTTQPRAPKPFVDAMPRPFIDPLPVLAGRLKSKPAPTVDHEITYAEAEPWLAGPDRAVFEKRFAIRLRDPVFRKAVEPNVARYPSWDRRLHPEKYAPKPAPPK